VRKMWDVAQWLIRRSTGRQPLECIEGSNSSLGIDKLLGSHFQILSPSQGHMGTQPKPLETQSDWQTMG
jgi:hypothetical protein